MEVKATISSVWVRRMLMLGAFLFGIGGWFFFDGLFWWPELNRRWTAHEELKIAGKESEWPAVAEKNGWPLEPPEKLYKDHQLAGQLVLGSAAIAVSLAVIGWYLVCRRRAVRFDGTTITGDSGRTLALERVIDMDLKKWDSKGIAVAIYEENGVRKRLTIDDYKYDGAIAIVRALRKHLLDTGRWKEDPKPGESEPETPSERENESQ